MRALSLRGSRQAVVIEAPDPQPGDGEVLVRITACGVCGSDLNAWRGVDGIDYPLPPGAPGHETIGQVLALGRGIQTLRVGQLVTGLLWNGLAELGVTRAENLVVAPADRAELLGEPLACAMNVVRRAALVPSDRFAIVGFGYLAALVVQLLPPDQRWIAISRRVDSRNLATRLGAEAVYDFETVPSYAWDSFPVVVEAAGVQQTLDFATWLTAYGGRLVIAGYHADGPRTVNMQSWNWKGIDVINAHERQPAVSVAALRTAYARLDRRAAAFDVRQLHTHFVPLAEAADAFQLAEERPPGFVKVIVCP